MITVNQLELKQGKLFIDAETSDLSKALNVKIVTQDYFISDTVINTEHIIYSSSNATSSLSAQLTEADLDGTSLRDNMFFVYFFEGDTIADMEVTFCKCCLAEQVLKYARELNDPCELPKGFIDSILRYEAIKYAIISRHYECAIKFFKMFKSGGVTAPSSNCGCNGN